VGKGLRAAPRDALIAGAVAKNEAGRAFGFHRAMDHAGAVVGPLLATLLLGLGWPLRHVFWLAICPGVLSVIAVATVREPSRANPNALGSKATAISSERLAADVQLAKRPAVESKGISRALRIYFGILLLFSLGNSSDAFLLLRAKELGVPIAAMPLLWSVFHVAKLVSSYLGGRLADRIARPRLISVGWVVYAVTYLAFGLATEAWQAWLRFVVYGSYYGLTEPAEKALVKDLAPESSRGRAYGWYNFMIGISSIPAGLLTGWLWQAFGAPTALAVGASIAVLSAFLLSIWARASQRVSQNV
jgi:MFS family permease